MPRHPPLNPGGLRQRRYQALHRMRRAEIATYVAATLSAAVSLMITIPARQWFNVGETVAWAVILMALGYVLGRRHRAWAAVVLIAFLVFGLIARTVDAGRPPFVLLIAILVYLYIEAFRAARDYATLPSPPVEPAPPAA